MFLPLTKRTDLDLGAGKVKTLTGSGTLSISESSTISYAGTTTDNDAAAGPDTLRLTTNIALDSMTVDDEGIILVWMMGRRRS